MAESDSKLRSDMDQLRSDLSQLTKDVQALASERGRDAAETARQYGTQARDYASTRIESHPFASVLTAFGIGLVIGKLLDTRR